MPKIKKTIDIIEAAEKVYETIGLDKATVTDICEEANISRKTFYQRFKNLDGLLDNVLQHISETTIPRISEGEAKKDSWERLWRMLDIYDMISEDHPIVRALYSAHFERWVSWKQIAFADRLDQIICRLLTETIETGISRGVFREVDSRAIAKTIIAVTSICFFHHSNSLIFTESPAVEIKSGLKLMLERTLRP